MLCWHCIVRELYIVYPRSHLRPECVLAPVPLAAGGVGLQDQGRGVRNVRFRNLSVFKMKILMTRTSYCSVLTILSFSFERYLAICHPLYLYTMSGTKRTTR